jgi:Domain of unknown function (DUF1707)
MAEQPGAAENGQDAGAEAAVPAVRPGAGPEVRATHAERDRTVEILRDAAGDGQLTAEELDERVEAALSARTGRELAALTADLGRAEPAARAVKDLVKIDQKFGDVERTGRWTVPRKMVIKATAGTVKLDFTEAVIGHPTLELEIDLGLGSDLLLITKPGVAVETDDLTVRRADVKIQADDGQVPVALTVTVSGQVRGGNVEARYPRRSFGQWMRREPHPYKPLPR